MVEEYFDDLIREQYDNMVKFRREIHRHPELGMDTKNTADLVQKYATDLGLKYHRVENGIWIDVTERPKIALRADMDALPILEATKLPFSSEIPGVMHACGHDLHTSILLGLMPILKKLNLPVRLLFQPGEEIGKGALHMIKNNALEGIEYIFGLHSWTSLEPGEYYIVKGSAMASVDNFRIVIHGNGGHAAYPHLTFDTVAEASRVINYLLEIPSRKVNPLEHSVLSIGYIRGGTANNIIPYEVEMGGTVRTLKEDVSTIIESNIRAISNEHIYVEYHRELPVLKNDVTFASLIDREVGEKLISKEVPPTMGGEDFAYYCRHAKCAFAFLGTGKINGVEVSKHSNIFDIREEAMIYGAYLHMAAIQAAQKALNSI